MVIHSSSNIDVPVTAKAVHRATLMKEDFIKLSFDADVDYKLKAGDYIEFRGMNYYLPDDYYPTMKDEATFSYELQFNAPWYNLDKIMFLFNTYNGDTIVKRESDWYITDTAQNILALIIRSTRDESRHCECVFNEVLDCEPTVSKTFTFSSTSILAALNTLAKEFELEWWVTFESGNYYLHFGECDNSITRDTYGAVEFDANTGVRARDASLVTSLTAGENVTKPSVSQKQGLKKEYWVFGSSRNIDQDATNDMNAGFVTSIVTKRLELAGNPQVKTEGSGEEVVIFDDIYPRSDYRVTGVSSKEQVTDEVIGYEDGEPVFKRYLVYNLQIADFSTHVFNIINTDDDVQNIEDIVASGKPLSIKFITKDYNGQTVTPKLAGFEFEVGAILVTDSQTGNQWYELQIQHQEINGYIIPNANLVPEVGDFVCIFNIKGKYIDGSEELSAQNELQAAFDKWYANKKKDISYTIKPYANEDIDLELGDAVTLNYKENSVTSRVFSFEKKIDLLLAGLGCCDASYTISSYAKFGSVNQLKEDVKILTASIANGTAGGGGDAGSISNAVATYGQRLFLSKKKDDTAAGHIVFKEGITSEKASSMQRTTFGTFNSGFLGSGAIIDEHGNAEFKSIYSREFISTPEFRFNRITVTEGEQWNTNGFGIIDRVVLPSNGNRGKIYLKLEDGDRPSVKAGDICRGIYNNIGYKEENGLEHGITSVVIDGTTYSIDQQPDTDDCGFPTKDGFFTSYFYVYDEPTMDANGDWYFEYVTRGEWSGDNDTPHPCKNMKFAQYGSFTRTDRQSSLYQTSIRHSYIQQLELVNSWVIQPFNIASRYGYLGDLTVLLKNSDGTTYEQTLPDGNGLYVQDNVYFGGATIQLDPVTVADIKRQLANYSVSLTAYTDVIKVDDDGNVIDGLWVDTGVAPDVSRQYRFTTAITVRNGIDILTIDLSQGETAASGKFKVHVQPHGCTCLLDHSTLHITGIDNVRNGVDDNTAHDAAWYEAMRAVEHISVDLVIDCEGIGNIVKTVPFAVKHESVPYIIADLTNENASIAWDGSTYIGLPVETTINMAKGNEQLPIQSITIVSINGVAPTWSMEGYGMDDIIKVDSSGWRFTTNTITGLFKVTAAPSNAAAVTEILIDCVASYAGVNITRRLSLHITKTAGTEVWELVPTHQFIKVDKNSYFDYNTVGVDLYCTDGDGRRLVTTLPTGFELCFQIITILTSQVGSATSVTPEESMALDGSVTVNNSSYNNTISCVRFLLYDADSMLLDKEEVPILRDGTGGQGSTGPAGNGISVVTTYYLRTLENVTPNVGAGATQPAGCDGNWGLTLNAPTASWPWLWRFTKIEYTAANDYLSAAELIAIYPSAPNFNLLDDTAFVSEFAMEAWVYKGYVAKDSHADPHSEYYNAGDEGYDNFFGVVEGTKGYNAYKGRFKGSAASESYVILLQQRLRDDSVDKITQGQWYTLSFMVKGSGTVYVSLRGYSLSAGGNVETEFVDTTEVYVDGVSQANRTATINATNDWKMHTITFKTVNTITADVCYVQWSMNNSTTLNEILVCMPKLEVGMSATPYVVGGTSTIAFPRQGEWESEKNYYAGIAGERYLDAVFHNNGWYRCIKSHVSSSANSPSSENYKTYWRQASYEGFTATGLLLAQAAYIENLGAKMLRTGEGNSPHVEMEGAVVKFFGTLGIPSIELAVDNDGVGVLRFYNRDGNPMYDLGPNGIMENFGQEQTAYQPRYYKGISTSDGIMSILSVSNGSVLGVGYETEYRYYLLKEGYKALKTGSSVLCTYNISNQQTPSAWNGLTVTNNNYDDVEDLRGVTPSGSSKLISDGWYCGVVIELGELDGEHMHFVELYHFEDGAVTETQKVYFLDSDVVSNGQNATWYDEEGNSHQNEAVVIDNLTP